ncbi:hypothetical protein IOD14_01445 [Streptomyces sp. A2-16]|uniref:hypothetical protein n=1 Tax=Streptomyces sp. A2-16 TaxID=2781734 RepID=UPI001BB0B0AA|nr:hypothetical protein [Streptomyces sp. A2-16]QUC55561.1 hypothetical protein IOD14_01445 [Streptomyces sp. A2-16]
MDQATAALLGAVVGIVGTTTAAGLAAWQGRWATRTQIDATNSQWRRQMQRDAYSALIQQAMSISRLFDEIDYKICNGQYADSHTDPMADAAAQGLHDLSAATFAAILEGPSDLADVAGPIEDAHREWWIKLRTFGDMVAEGQDGDEERAAMITAQEASGVALGRFMGRAQAYLNHG